MEIDEYADVDYGSEESSAEESEEMQSPTPKTVLPEDGEQDGGQPEQTDTRFEMDSHIIPQHLSLMLQIVRFSEDMCAHSIFCLFYNRGGEKWHNSPRSLTRKSDFTFISFLNRNCRSQNTGLGFPTVFGVYPIKAGFSLSAFIG